MESKIYAAICTVLVFILYFVIKAQFSIYGKFWRIANKNSEKAMIFFSNEKDWHLSHNKEQLESMMGRGSYTFYTNDKLYSNKKVYLIFDGNSVDEKLSMQKFLSQLK